MIPIMRVIAHNRAAEIGVLVLNRLSVGRESPRHAYAEGLLSMWGVGYGSDSIGSDPTRHNGASRHSVRRQMDKFGLAASLAL